MKQFGYERRRDYSAMLHLLAKVDEELRIPAGVMLLVQNDALRRGYAPLASSRTACSSPAVRLRGSRNGLWWQVEFAVSLAVVEYPHAVFSLVAHGRGPVALPAPCLLSIDTPSANRNMRVRAATIRRRATALAAGFAVAAAPGLTAGVADAGTVGHGKLHKPATSNMVTSASHDGTQPSTIITKSTTVTLNGIAPHGTSIHHKHRHHNHRDSLHQTAPGTQDKAGHHKPTKPKLHKHHRGLSHPSGAHGHHNRQAPPHQIAPGTQDKAAHHKPTKPDVHNRHPGLSQHSGSHLHHHVSGTAVVAPAPPTPPALPAAPGFITPATTANSNDASTMARWLGQTAGSSAWPAGLNPDAFANAAVGQTSALLATGNQPPAFLIPIYQAAAKRYHVPWQILAAINWIETDYGQNLNTSSAGAIGWMQFMPATWQQYGVAADGHSQPNPYSPRDAIFSAAHYLAANGAAQNLPKAIFAYNHAAWYVAQVIWRAQIISDHAGASTNTSLAGTGQTGLAGAETMLVAAFSAVGGPYSQANHDSFGQSAANLRRAGTDCSGFVSWVLDQVDPGFGNQTTVTLPGQPGVQPGVGQYVTMWDRPLPGNQGHVIINILGTWFESGGNSAYNPAGGISPMSEAQAVGELTGGGFVPYHLKSL